MLFLVKIVFYHFICINIRYVDLNTLAFFNKKISVLIINILVYNARNEDSTKSNLGH